MPVLNRFLPGILRATVCLAVLLSPIYGGIWAGEGDDGRPAEETRLSVLIVSDSGGEARAAGFAELLAEHGVDSDVTGGSYTEGAQKRVAEYDLVILVGKSRPRLITPVHEFEKPVLGVGPFGCAYFGKLHLKNGQPYT